MQKGTLHVLNATSTSWRSLKEIQRVLARRGLKGHLTCNALFKLFQLEESGFVEMRKEIVLGENGGELAYKFRRKVWQGAAI